MVNSINVLKAVALVGAAFLSSEAKTEEQLQGGWATNCVSLGRDTPKQCSMNHIVKMQSTGQVLLNITVRVAVKENQMPFLDIIGPLGIFIPKGLGLSVDDNQLLRLPIQRCDINGCFAGIVLRTEHLTRLQDGKILTISFSPQPDQGAEIKVPLSGFALAYGNIKH